MSDHSFTAQHKVEEKRGSIRRFHVKINFKKSWMRRLKLLLSLDTINVKFPRSHGWPVLLMAPSISILKTKKKF